VPPDYTHNVHEDKNMPFIWKRKVKMKRWSSLDNYNPLIFHYFINCQLPEEQLQSAAADTQLKISPFTISAALY